MMKVRNMGPYDPKTEYRVGDVVTFEDGAFRCVQPVKGVSPNTNVRFDVWKRLNQDTAQAVLLMGGGSVDEVARDRIDQLTEEMAFKPEDYGLPVLALNGDCTGMTKDNPVNLAYTFMGMSGSVAVKKQGSSSIEIGKEIGKDFDTELGGLFNFTLKFPEAFEAKEGWGAQKKYCFKANAIDHTHARNLMSCKLWGEMVRTRSLKNVFDLSKVTGFKTTAGGDVSSQITITSTGFSTSTATVYNQGYIYMDGQEFAKGVYRVSCKAICTANSGIFVGFCDGAEKKLVHVGCSAGVEKTIDVVVVNPYEISRLIVIGSGGETKPTIEISGIKVTVVVGGSSYFDIAYATGFVDAGGNTITAPGASLNGDTVRINRSQYAYGHTYMTGQTFASGKYKVALTAYCGRGESEPNKTVCIGFGRPNAKNAYKTYTLGSRSTWEYVEVDVDNPVDDAYLFVAPEGGANAVDNNNMQFQFSGISVSTSIVTLPNGGAVDGFPIIVTLNGKYYALGTFNIPKDKWMFGNPKAILCAEAHTPSNRFEALATLNGDFELEYVEDEDNADWVLPSLNRAIQSVIDGDGAGFNDIGKYIDIPSAIDYFIHTVDERATDAIDKNYLLVTFDGVKWYFSAYDRDTTYGLQWHGKGFNPATGGPLYTAYSHRLMTLIRAYRKADLKARAIELREGIKSEAHVADVFTNFGAGIPDAVLAQNCKRWPLLRSTSVSNTAQILNWYRMRRAVLDKDIDAL